MGTKIKPDFQPDDNSLALVAKHGAIREFCADQHDHFMLYWLDTGTTKRSWQATWQVWMKRAWTGKCGRDWEKSRHYRTQGASSGDPFAKVLDNLQGQIDLSELKEGETMPIQSQPAPVYQMPQRNPNDESMSSEDAFAELRRMGMIK